MRKGLELHAGAKYREKKRQSMGRLWMIWLNRLGPNIITALQNQEGIRQMKNVCYQNQFC